MREDRIEFLPGVGNREIRLIGVSEIELSVAAVTVTVVEPVMPFTVAEIVEPPAAIAVTVPRAPPPPPPGPGPPPPVETWATLGVEDTQVACAVTSCCVLSS